MSLSSKNSVKDTKSLADSCSTLPDDADGVHERPYDKEAHFNPTNPPLSFKGYLRRLFCFGEGTEEAHHDTSPPVCHLETMERPKMVPRTAGSGAARCHGEERSIPPCFIKCHSHPAIDLVRWEKAKPETVSASELFAATESSLLGLVGEVIFPRIGDFLQFPELFCFALTCKAIYRCVDLKKKKCEYRDKLLSLHSNRPTPINGPVQFCGVCLYRLPEQYFSACNKVSIAVQMGTRFYTCRTISLPKPTVLDAESGENTSAADGTEEIICNDCLDFRRRIKLEKSKQSLSGQCIANKPSFDEDEIEEAPASPVWRPHTRRYKKYRLTGELLCYRVRL